MRLIQRLDALERSTLDTHPGYAVVEVQPGQTIPMAKSEWEAAHGPIGGRQVVVFDFGGLRADV